MKPMLPTLTVDIPETGDWCYEVKYDGFRAIIDWTPTNLHIWSRNGKDLLPAFPELEHFLRRIEPEVSSHLPLMMDSELVLLASPYKAHFQPLQQRGRMKAEKKIQAVAAIWPCSLLVFDLLKVTGNDIRSLPYKERKTRLYTLFKQLQLPLAPEHDSDSRLQLLPFSLSFHDIWDQVHRFNGEGIIAKLAGSPWQEGKRTSSWLKMKNWRKATCFITGYDTGNGYFHVGVMNGDNIHSIGQFKAGLDQETSSTLKKSIKENHTEEQTGVLLIHPSICLDLYYLELEAAQMREPRFHSFHFDMTPDQCSIEQFLLDEAMLPQGIEITHPEKPLLSKNDMRKLDYIRYLRTVSPYMLPFLENRLLTLIRAPHGQFGESFYQKSKPATAPSFVKSALEEDTEMIICDSLETLIWLGNQLAIEFHIPFQMYDRKNPSEIVIDLDPPGRDDFSMAVNAALILKQLFDQLKLTCFVKLSGNKGMQLYIPFEDDCLTWEETKEFTQFAAKFLIMSDPDSFTIERLKKNRGGRLYVDFIQHAKGKTIIAPYSVRNNEDGLVAAPLFWHEVEAGLHPEGFTIREVEKRILTVGDPFRTYFSCRKRQPVRSALKIIRDFQTEAFPLL